VEHRTQQPGHHAIPRPATRPRERAARRRAHRAYSRHWPQFNREDLARSLTSAGIRYVFLGRELGGKPDDPALRGPRGLPDYDAIAATPRYQDGLARLVALGAEQRTAFMCSEGDPAHCHRERLVARSLRAAGWRVHHILSDGTLQGEVQASL
jgi:uncharacterized protein (DUF488 family)